MDVEAAKVRLTELSPQWLEKDGQRVGVMFDCPHCRKVKLTCFWVAMPIWGEELGDGTYAGQMGCVRRALDAVGNKEEPENAVVPCEPTCKWAWNGQAFDSITLQPSLDASKSGHWHGFITNGAIA